MTILFTKKNPALARFHFFGLGEISDVEKALVGVGYNREDLTKAFEAIDIRRYFGNVTVDILVNLLLGVEE